MIPGLEAIQCSLFEHYEMRNKLLLELGKYLQKEYSCVTGGLEINLRQLDNRIAEMHHQVLSMQLGAILTLMATADSGGHS